LRLTALVMAEVGRKEVHLRGKTLKRLC